MYVFSPSWTTLCLSISIRLLLCSTYNRILSLLLYSLRAKFAVENEPINQLHGSANPEEAERELNFFFPQQQTLAVIKPDALEEHRGFP